MRTVQKQPSCVCTCKAHWSCWLSIPSAWKNLWLNLFSSSDVSTWDIVHSFVGHVRSWTLSYASPFKTASLSIRRMHTCGWVHGDPVCNLFHNVCIRDCVIVGGSAANCSVKYGGNSFSSQCWIYRKTVVMKHSLTAFCFLKLLFMNSNWNWSIEIFNLNVARVYFSNTCRVV